MHLAVDQSSPMSSLFHSPPARKPGRSLGVKARVVQDARALGIIHFAFVRFSLLGLDLRDAFNRYLAWSETTTDLRCSIKSSRLVAISMPHCQKPPKSPNCSTSCTVMRLSNPRWSFAQSGRLGAVRRHGFGCLE